MYVYRNLELLHEVPYEQWRIEELAYHQDAMTSFKPYLNEDGLAILQQINAEIESRGGLPVYQAAYDHATHLHYD